MTYKDFYAQALLQALPIAYDVAKATCASGLPNPELIAKDAAQLAEALTAVFSETVAFVANGDQTI
jgi:hypothetical protein